MVVRSVDDAGHQAYLTAVDPVGLDEARGRAFAMLTRWADEALGRRPNWACNRQSAGRRS